MGEIIGAFSSFLLFFFFFGGGCSKPPCPLPFWKECRLWGVHKSAGPTFFKLLLGDFDRDIQGPLSRPSFQLKVKRCP